jgi:hypothetical protein
MLSEHGGDQPGSSLDEDRVDPTATELFQQSTEVHAAIRGLR